MKTLKEVKKLRINDTLIYGAYYEGYRDAIDGIYSYMLVVNPSSEDLDDFLNELKYK